MKGILKTTIILGIIFIVSGVLATALFFASFDWNFENSDYFGYVNNSKDISITGINEVKLNFVSEDIILEKIPGENFVFNLSGYYPKSESGEFPELKLSSSGEVLNVYIEYPQKRYILGINSRDSNIYVGVPEKYYNEFNINVVSGDSEISEVNFSIFEIKSVSGDINVENSHFEESGFTSVSGEITAKNSGNINLIESVSGDVDILEYEIGSDMKIETISGDVGIDLKENSSVNVVFDSVSGDLENSFGKIADGENEIFVETTSGDLRVY